jgi:hypothetical protein
MGIPVNDDLEHQLEEIERLVFKVRGFAGIGIVDYGEGERIEVAAVDESALQELRLILGKSRFNNLPVLTRITGKTTFL